MDRTGIAHTSQRLASWNGQTLAFSGVSQPDDGSTPYLLLTDMTVENGVPILDAEQHDIPAPVLIWPTEQLISRHFMLPLAQARLIDAEIMAQELYEQAGDAASEYWLAWQAGKGDAGVEGVVFGLPNEAKQTLESQAGWRECEAIVPDAWVRLCAWLAEDIPETNFAVLDEDREGLFVGVHSPAGWRGMRRINKAPWKSQEDLAEDVLRTLKAMGWRPEADSATGRLSTDLLQSMPEVSSQWHGHKEDDAALPDRHQANLGAAATVPHTELNFRHGPWRKRSNMGVSLRRWRHTFVLLGLVCVVSIVGGIWKLVSLQHQADGYRSEIVSAFHRGLPDEKVMLDPLAQLRMADRGTSAASETDDFLRRLAVVAKASKSVPGWSISEIDYNDEGIRLFGVANDFGVVNRIRDALAAGGADNVQIEDTEAQGKQVGFRIGW